MLNINSFTTNKLKTILVVDLLDTGLDPQQLKTFLLRFHEDIPALAEIIKEDILADAACANTVGQGDGNIE